MPLKISSINGINLADQVLAIDLVPLVVLQTVANPFYKVSVCRYYRDQERGVFVSTQPELATEYNTTFTTPDNGHEGAVSLDGLEHIFKWASEVVSDGEDERIRQAREKRVRRQVLEVVSQYQQQRIAAKGKEEIAYLQRRVIALLQKVQDLTEENAAVKQVMVSQYWSIQRVPELELQVRQLKSIEFEREAAVMERRYLMDALAKLKVERDYLEDTLVSAEQENTRLANLLKDTKSDLQQLRDKRWWHIFTNLFNRDTKCEGNLA